MYIAVQIVAWELKDPIWHSLEWQIESFSSEATRYIWYIIIINPQILEHSEIAIFTSSWESHFPHLVSVFNSEGAV